MLTEIFHSCAYDYFRTCETCGQLLFDKLIKTETIKALTNFFLTVLVGILKYVLSVLKQMVAQYRYSS